MPNPPIVLGVLLVAVLLSGCQRAADEAALPGVVRDPPPIVAGLTFHDHSQGDAPTEVELVAPDGELILAYFGYLSCPDMCPMTMADLRRARQQLGPELAARTTVAFITVDPDRDGPAELREYLGFFFDHGTLALRAPDDAALAVAAERFGVRYELEQPARSDGSYEVAHTAITYLIDDTGTIVRELPFGATADDYARAITAHLEPTAP